MSRGTRRSAHEWRGLIEAQRQSGQTIDAFCAMHGIGKSTLGKWKRRLAGSPAVSAPTRSVAPLFAPLSATPVAAPPAVRPRAGRWTVELDLGDGVCLRLRAGA